MKPVKTPAIILADESSGRFHQGMEQPDMHSDLLAKWQEIQQRPSQGMTTVGSVQRKSSEEIQILESLMAAGCSQIPGEAFDVRFMLEDRKRLLREMRERLSQI